MNKPEQRYGENPNGTNCVGGNGMFRFCARWISNLTGSPAAFIVATVCVIIWAAMGPMFHYSDTWQLVINTASSIITFLMVFLIQNTQNRDTRAMQLKLDELLRAVQGARTSMVNLESLSDEELDLMQEQFERLGRLAKPHGEERKTA